MRVFSRKLIKGRQIEKEREREIDKEGKRERNLLRLEEFKKKLIKGRYRELERREKDIYI